MKAIYSSKDNCLTEIWEGYIPVKEMKITFNPPINFRVIECAIPNTFVDGVKYEEGKDYIVEQMDFLTNPIKRTIIAIQCAESQAQ